MADIARNSSTDSDDSSEETNKDLFDAPGTEAPGQQSLWEITETTPPRN
jgi:hypothetical protein